MRPTIDRVLRPGAATSVSEQRDNIHWFVAMDGPAFALDVVVSGLDPAAPPGDALARAAKRGRFYVDPRAAEPDGGDRLRAPILSHAQALARYGRG
jgi:hypothetical protein